MKSNECLLQIGDAIKAVQYAKRHAVYQSLTWLKLDEIERDLSELEDQLLTKAEREES